MLYVVKLNREELLIAKKGLVFLHFIWSKNLTKFSNLSLKEGGRRGWGDISTKNLLKNSKVNC